MGSLRMPAIKGETIHGWQWFPSNGCDGDGPAWVGSLGIKFGFWEKEISPGRTAQVIVTGTMSKEPLFACGDHPPALTPALVWVGKIGGPCDLSDDDRNALREIHAMVRAGRTGNSTTLPARRSPPIVPRVVAKFAT